MAADLYTSTCQVKNHRQIYTVDLAVQDIVMVATAVQVLALMDQMEVQAITDILPEVVVLQDHSILIMVVRRKLVVMALVEVVEQAQDL